MATVKCPQCGSSNWIDAQNCAQCGAALPQVSDSSAASSPAREARPVDSAQSSVFVPSPVTLELAVVLRCAGWLIAVAAAIAGGSILNHAPDAPDRFGGLLGRSDPLAEIKSLARLTYLSVGWGSIVGGVVTGVLFHVVADIAVTVSEIWKAQRTGQ